ncbi:hypothetical protein D3C83_33010 [compost metagenome]
MAANLGFDRRERGENAARIRQQIAAVEFSREMRHRAADVRRQQLEQILHRRREPPHAELRVEEQHGDARAGEQVRQIVVGGFELCQL